MVHPEELTLAQYCGGKKTKGAGASSWIMESQEVSWCTRKLPAWSRGGAVKGPVLAQCSEEQDGMGGPQIGTSGEKPLEKGTGETQTKCVKA